MPTSGYSDEDVGLVLSVTDPTSLFGDNERRARIRYRRLAKSVHPDANGNSPESVEAMKRLNALWDAYRGVDSRVTAGMRKPTEITRNASYVILDEHDTWLVVDRSVSDGMMGRSMVLDGLRDTINRSPVCMLSVAGNKVLSQPDGLHVAYTCSVPDCVSYGRTVIMLGSLGDMLPNGTLHPADLAWIAKRAIFLDGALEHNKLEIRRDSTTDVLAIAPDSHMLVVVAPWAIGNRNSTTYWQVTNGLLSTGAELFGNDRMSRRIVTFMRGVAVDHVTSASDMLREFDDLLIELFGGLRFHEMETKR